MSGFVCCQMRNAMTSRNAVVRPITMGRLIELLVIVVPLQLESQAGGELDLSRIADGGWLAEAGVGCIGVWAGSEGPIWDEVVAVVERVEGFGYGFETEAVAEGKSSA